MRRAVWVCTRCGHVSPNRSSHMHPDPDGIVGVERVLRYQDDDGVLWDHAEDPYSFDQPYLSFTFTEEMLFVPPGAKATLDDGREVEGPLFIVAARLSR